MKFKVTVKGVHGVEVGSVVDLEGPEVPAWLVNKGYLADESPKTMIVNPEADKDDLITQAEELGIEVDRRWGVQRLQGAIDTKLGE